MVAPSFKDFTRLSEPFIKGAKFYVRVKNPKTGNEREVRWYSDTEYAKAYGNKLLGDEVDKSFPMLKHARGFDNGPILVIRGHRAEDEAWLKASNARYAVGIGWYIVSTETLPEDAPKHFKYLLLGWDEFRNGDDYHMKKPAELAAILDKKIMRKEWFNIA